MTELSLHDRKVIYRARRGLKELDLYFDPYVREQYVTDTDAHKAAFGRLIEEEDPDLLDWFTAVTVPTDPELQMIVQHLKSLRHNP